MVETFHSLQGEGFHAGRSAFFIRLAGCTVGCSWCDTKHSWHDNKHQRLSLPQLSGQVAAAKQRGAGFVVITGGEPLHHDLTPLCEELAQHRLPLHLETSGVDPLSGRFNWITLSPKRHRPPNKILLQHCHELKVIVHDKDDLAFAEASAIWATNAGNKPVLLLQPGWGAKAGELLALDYVRRHPNWRLSLQSHKWLAIR